MKKALSSQIRKMTQSRSVSLCLWPLPYWKNGHMKRWSWVEIKVSHWSSHMDSTFHEGSSCYCLQMTNLLNKCWVHKTPLLRETIWPLKFPLPRNHMGLILINIGSLGLNFPLLPKLFRLVSWSKILKIFMIQNTHRMSTRSHIQQLWD